MLQEIMVCVWHSFNCTSAKRCFTIVAHKLLNSYGMLVTHIISAPGWWFQTRMGEGSVGLE